MTSSLPPPAPSPRFLPFPGAKSEQVLQALDVFQNTSLAKARLSSLEAARLEPNWRFTSPPIKSLDISVVEMKDQLPQNPCARTTMMCSGIEWESKENIHPILSAVCTEITPEGVSYRDGEGEHFLQADTVILSAGMRENQDEALRYAQVKGSILPGIATARRLEIFRQRSVLPMPRPIPCELPPYVGDIKSGFTPQ